MQPAIKERTGKEFPNDPIEQLWGAICAVFRSWMNERAILYRKMEGIPDEWGTAVSVMAMVFGNMGETSATGVCFSRDAANGENLFNGEYLVNAQGEDVVAGIRTPQQITKIGSQRWAERAGISEEERATKYPSKKYNAILDEFHPDVVHLNNIHSQLSPIVAELAHQRGIKVVWTLHDYKLLCPRYDCMRNDGASCDDCFANHNFSEKKQKRNVLKNKCMKNSYLASYIAYKEALTWNREILDVPNFQGNAVINYTEAEIPYTRIIEHKHFEMFGNEVEQCPKTVISKEYSTEWTDDMEPYYPINDNINNALADKYRALASQEEHVIFGGRLAEYKYYDMAPIIENVFKLFN